MKKPNLDHHPKTTNLLSDKKVMQTYVLFVVLIIYMLYNTGLVSDDFSFILDAHGYKSFLDCIIYSNNYIARPVFKYVFSIYYYFVDLNNYVLIELLKVFLVTLIFYTTTKFFLLFTNKESAIIASFLFVFYPTHETTSYWYLEVSLSLCISSYLYAYYLVYNNRLVLAGLISVLASFVSYGSPPIAFVLTALCFLNKTYKKGLILLIPTIVYSTYFILQTLGQRLEILPESGVFYSRLPADMNIISVLKSFVLQILTFTDAMLGPSFFMKIYYSILANSKFSFMVIILFIAGFLFISKLSGVKKKRTSIDRNLLLVLVVLTIGSLAMFALTGGYPQLAFNLGNRTTIYGSLLASYLIVSVPIPEKVRRLVLLIFLVAIIGISSHWKEWNQQQKHVINNIKNNQGLSSYKGNEPIFISGNQYSKLGPFSHIEFLSENWVVNSIVKLAGHENLKGRTLNKRLIWKEGILMDDKYKNIKYQTGSSINVYDSINDKLIKFASQDINSYIKKLPDDKRHWVQMICNEKINDLILKLIPKIKYAL